MPGTQQVLGRHRNQAATLGQFTSQWVKESNNKHHTFVDYVAEYRW